MGERSREIDSLTFSQINILLATCTLIELYSTISVYIVNVIIIDREEVVQYGFGVDHI